MALRHIVFLLGGIFTPFQPYTNLSVRVPRPRITHIVVKSMIKSDIAVSLALLEAKTP